MCGVIDIAFGLMMEGRGVCLLVKQIVSILIIFSISSMDLFSQACCYKTDFYGLEHALLFLVSISAIDLLGLVSLEKYLETST